MKVLLILLSTLLVLKKSLVAQINSNLTTSQRCQKNSRGNPSGPRALKAFIANTTRFTSSSMILPKIWLFSSTPSIYGIELIKLLLIIEFPTKFSLTKASLKCSTTCLPISSWSFKTLTSSSFSLLIVFLLLWLKANLWRKGVFVSPSLSHWIIDLYFQKNPSLRRISFHFFLYSSS